MALREELHLWVTMEDVLNVEGTKRTYKFMHGRTKYKLILSPVNR